MKLRGSEETLDFSTSSWLCIQALENKDHDGLFSADYSSFQRVCVPIGCSTEVDDLDAPSTFESLIQ